MTLKLAVLVQKSQGQLSVCLLAESITEVIQLIEREPSIANSSLMGYMRSFFLQNPG